jgi:transcriptional regulator with XRE-family HTH domain
MQVTGDQLRAARALLRLEQADLAQRACVSVVTIRRLESGSAKAPASEATLASVRHALEQAGAEFIEAGVRRRPAENPSGQALFDDLYAISLRSAEKLRGQDVLTDADLYDEGGLPA